MKALIASLVLFLSVCVFVTANTVFLKSVFKDMRERLEILPDTPEETEQLSDEDITRIKEELERIEKMWKKRKEYIYVMLEHNVSARFTEFFLPTKEYFTSEDYPSYLASLRIVKDIVKQFETNEGVSLENIF